jgi:hemerythrin-like domain-containing protein
VGPIGHPRVSPLRVSKVNLLGKPAPEHARPGRARLTWINLPIRNPGKLEYGTVKVNLIPQARRKNMSKVLNIIRDEHRSIAAVLHGMQYLAQQIDKRAANVDPRVFRAMLYYLDTFCERMHHPKEDQFLFAAMRRRGKVADAVIAELEREHQAGAQELRVLEQNLVRYEEGGEKEFQNFAKAVERFVQNYWNHMRKEEEKVFPFAQELLTAADWKAIDRAFEENRDPLGPDRDIKDFQKLFSRIVDLAPPPIGVGPELGSGKPH